MASNNEPPAINAVPESNGQIPKLGFNPFGTHLVLVKNSHNSASSERKKSKVPSAKV